MVIEEQGQTQILSSDTLISNLGWSKLSFKKLLIHINFPVTLSEFWIPQVWGEESISKTPLGLSSNTCYNLDEP